MFSSVDKTPAHTKVGIPLTFLNTFTYISHSRAKSPLRSFFKYQEVMDPVMSDQYLSSWEINISSPELCIPILFPNIIQTTAGRVDNI